MRLACQSCVTNRSFPLAIGVVACAAFLAPAARAQVVQTGDNTPLPQAVGQPEIQLSMDLGWRENTPAHQDMNGVNLNPPRVYSDFFPTFRNGDAVKLSGLFKWRKEQIDERADARTAPGYFSPSCGFTAELVLRGGDCNVQLGWYNVTDPNDPTPPAPNEIYPLVPESTEADSSCMGQNGEPRPAGSGFCPLGWDNHHPYKLSQLAWIPKAHDSGEIKTDPNYKGGYVAFALIGNPSARCKQTKHSMALHNVKSAQNNQPWITTLIYQSTVDPSGFYIAFEDLPMAPESWKVPTGGATNDGDFNDFVYFISGITCQGGGQPCRTALQGACSLGRTDCSVGGETSMCRPIIQPGAELCDNVDNDCNGQVDDGDGLCQPGYACDKGTCVKSCSGGEFSCAGALVCENGVCIDPACQGVKCDPGLACRNGVCVDPCVDANCPAGQECQLGRCIDPCAGVTCPAGRVCERGLCLSNCACRGCGDGLQCGGDGHCSDPACAGITCPPGQRCRQGTCFDPCEGVTCPGGGRCVDGTCGEPNPGVGGSAGAGGGLPGTGGTFGIAGVSGSGTGNTGGSDAAPAAGKKGAPDPGCGCRVKGDRATSLAWLTTLLGASAWFALRRRRRAVTPACARGERRPPRRGRIR
jgi:hypothetical protein